MGHFELHDFGWLTIMTKITWNLLNKIIKSQNLNVSRLVLELSFPNPLKSGVKSRTMLVATKVQFILKVWRVFLFKKVSTWHAKQAP